MCRCMCTEKEREGERERERKRQRECFEFCWRHAGTRESIDIEGGQGDCGLPLEILQGNFEKCSECGLKYTLHSKPISLNVKSST